jgi:hypothetical protein
MEEYLVIKSDVDLWTAYNVKRQQLNAHRLETRGSAPTAAEKRHTGENHLLLQRMFRNLNFANPFRFTEQDEVTKFVRCESCPNCSDTTNSMSRNNDVYDIAHNSKFADRFWPLSATAYVKIKYQNGFPVMQIFTSTLNNYLKHSYMELKDRDWWKVNEERCYPFRVTLTNGEVIEFLCNCRLNEIHNCITDKDVNFRSIEFELHCFQSHSPQWQKEGLPSSEIYVYADNCSRSVSICKHELCSASPWDKNAYSYHIVHLTFEEMLKLYDLKSVLLYRFKILNNAFSLMLCSELRTLITCEMIECFKANCNDYRLLDFFNISCSNEEELETNSFVKCFVTYYCSLFDKEHNSMFVRKLLKRIHSLLPDPQRNYKLPFYLKNFVNTALNNNWHLVLKRVKLHLLSYKSNNMQDDAYAARALVEKFE